MRLTLEEAKTRYGEIENGVWKNEASWCVLFQVPETISQGWINSATGMPTEHIYINREVAAEVQKALALVEERGLVSELHTFDGCLMVRPVRGDPSSLSCHSYACAIDLNAHENPLGQEPALSPELVKCFTDAGFSWGGHFHRKDGMHFSLGWE